MNTGAKEYKASTTILNSIIEEREREIWQRVTEAEAEATNPILLHRLAFLRRNSARNTVATFISTIMV